MPPDISPAAFVAAQASLAEDVVVGPGAVIHESVQMGPRCVVESGAVLGKRPRLRPGSSAIGPDPGPLVVDEGVTICCGAVVYAGARIGAGTIIGDQTQIRERAVIGRGSVVGRASSIDFGARVGDRVVIQTGVYVTGGSVVEDDVFLGPGVQTTNDNTMGRHPRGEELLGPVLRRACRIGGAAVLVPGVEVGEEAFVAAGSVVTANVTSRQVVMGVPARSVRDVPEEDLIELWR